MKFFCFNNLKKDDKLKLNFDVIYVTSLKRIEPNSLVYIYSLDSLGNSMFQIVKNILDLFNKNINIKIIIENLDLRCTDIYLPLNLIKQIYNIEEWQITNRLIKTKYTLTKKSKKVGRKIGSTKVKSNFDKHKKFIFEELNKKTTKVEILNKIKLKNPLLKNTTPQALGQYIKKQNELKEIREQLRIKNKLQSIGELVEENGLIVHKKFNRKIHTLPKKVDSI